MKLKLAIGLLVIPSLVFAGEIISKPYTGMRLPRMQCLVTNKSNRDLFVIAQWLEAENSGTITQAPGQELQPGYAMNISSDDPRAARCKAIYDGFAGDIGLLLVSSTNGTQATKCCQTNSQGHCNWWSAVGCPEKLP